jgi:putative glutamine amidotransferase
VEALREAGIEPILVTAASPIPSLNGIDGVVLSGGRDVHPSRYRQQMGPHTIELDPDRDELEDRLLREALDTDLPVLAICRGLQFFNVVHGGTLLQHIEGHEVRLPDASLPAHEVTVESGTRLAEILGVGTHSVNSRHHQAVDRVGDGLVVSARAADGIIEGLERRDRRFAIAVQWHPEDQIHRLPEQLRLFEAFRAAL